MLKKLNRVTAGVNSKRPVKILQFGGGNFLHAFADWMVDIMNEKTPFNGDIIVVQPLRKGKPPLKDDQDHLFHVSVNGLQNGTKVSETRLITCIADTINPYDEFEKFLKTSENPDLEFIISNTTESGISFNGNDADPAVPAESFPGKLTSFLFHRFTHFKGANDKGVTLLPCELIERNAESLKKTVHQYITHWNLPADFKKWIDSSNSFYNTLVDRIVPGFPKDIIKEVQQATGYEDKHVVMAEPFHFWAIEAPATLAEFFPVDQFGLKGVFVDDLTPYQARKVRILNGSHTVMVPVAFINGFRTVRESVEDNQVGKFIRDTINEEIIPSLAMPREELTEFSNDVIERFLNPYIKHELSSIALNSISKFKVRVLPSILGYIQREQKLPKRLLYSMAALIRFYRGEWRGEKIPVNDASEVVSFFNEAWKSDDMTAVASKVLSNRKLWDNDLTEFEGVAEMVGEYLTEISRAERSGEITQMFH